MAEKGKRLIEFYGTECVHCKDMIPIMEKLEKEEGIKIEKMEVWHSSENARLMEDYDTDKDGNVICGGVPFFVNEKTGKKICGNTSYEKLKQWAMDK